MQVIIDVAEDDLTEVSKDATEHKRSRKAQLEWIIEDYVTRRLGKK